MSVAGGQTRAIDRVNAYDLNLSECCLIVWIGEARLIQIVDDHHDPFDTTSRLDCTDCTVGIVVSGNPH